MGTYDTRGGTPTSDPMFDHEPPESHEEQARHRYQLEVDAMAEARGEDETVFEIAKENAEFFKACADALAEVDSLKAELEQVKRERDIQKQTKQALIRGTENQATWLIDAQRDRDKLKAEVSRWREACNEGIGECGMLQEADGCDRERLETPEQVRDRLKLVAEHNAECTQEYERILGQQRRIGELKAELERLIKERDEARELCEDMDWMGDRCPSCGHRFRFSASGCPQCREPIPAPWQYPETMPDTCDCERCVDARKAAKEVT